MGGRAGRKYGEWEREGWGRVGRRDKQLPRARQEPDMAMERGGVWGFLDGWRPAETPTNSLLPATEVCRSNEKILNVKWKPIEKKNKTAL